MKALQPRWSGAVGKQLRVLLQECSFEDGDPTRREPCVRTLPSVGGHILPLGLSLTVALIAAYLLIVPRSAVGVTCFKIADCGLWACNEISQCALPVPEFPTRTQGASCPPGLGLVIPDPPRGQCGKVLSNVLGVCVNPAGECGGFKNEICPE
jgi:hypothetical protein